MPTFFGKYRGTVTSNRDPMSLGRLQVAVPAVLGDGRSSWAMPCVPFAGPGVGFFFLPPVNANIWVEFEAGNPDYPIWSGCFWSSGQVPAKPAVPEVAVFKIEGVTLTLGGLKKGDGFKVEVAAPILPQPLTLEMNADGIKLSNGTTTIVTITADAIELANNKTATVKLTAQDIEMKSPPLHVKLAGADSKIELSSGGATIALAAESVEAKQGAAAVKLSGSGVELTNSPAAIKVSSAGVELSSSPAKINVASANIELSNGAANVKLSPASVNVNNGALEVI